MNDVAIRVENLSKRYRIGKRQKSSTLRELLSNSISAAVRRPEPQSQESDFWALRDVSFEVDRGEVLGIIGSNGAGKSTLLKILSRITEPTTGCANVYGRVGSLLEVGTGFHPELSGRENVYLNGAILGMKRREIERKFDEIVEFAEVERFIDTAVKHYSSGMYVRLAFAVAAHFEPEVLIVDEVLAVGDASFQRKCLGTLGAMATGGRTIVLVTHNLAVMQRLATIAVLIEDGSVAAFGRTNEITDEYLRGIGISSQGPETGTVDLSRHRNPYGERALITRLEVLDANGTPTSTLAGGSSSRIVVDVKGVLLDQEVGLGIYFKSQLGQRIAGITTFAADMQVDASHTSASLTFNIDRLNLIPGRYQLELVIARKGVKRLDAVEQAATIEITDNDIFGTGEPVTSGYGNMFLHGHWQVSANSASVIL